MKTAEEILEEMIDLFQSYLNEIERENLRNTGFLYGEKTAYVECLEIIQQWEKADKNGLDYDIEEKFPL